MNKSRGFTLIELLVVIAIIGLLSTLAVVSLQSARQKSRDAKRLGDLAQLKTALEMYYNDQAVYPTGATLELGTGSDCGGNACDTVSQTNGVAATTAGTVYMANIPQDPSQPASECTSGATATCNYSYNQTDSGQGFDVWLYLESGTGNLNAGPTCLSENGFANTTCL
ncbi:MAG: type II secretion system protein [Patescibacteria group bacterium]